MDDQLDAKAQRGRRIVLAIIAVVLMICVSLILLRWASHGLQRLPVQLVRLGTTGLLCLFLYRGSGAARWITVVLFSISASVGFASGRAFLMAVATIHVGIGVTLAVSPSVSAYFLAKRRLLESDQNG